MPPKSFGSHLLGNSLASLCSGELVRAIPLEGEAALRCVHIVAPALGASAEAKTLLLRNAKQWTAIKDLHALTLLGSGEAEGRLFFVYEYRQGRLLTDILARCQQEGLPLSPDQTVYIAERLAGALLSVTASGTAYGCLSPERALVTFEGDVILLPGLFRDLHTSPVAGDPALEEYRRYLPPSLAVDRSTRPAADRFALGALMFEMLRRETFKRPGETCDPAARLEEASAGLEGVEPLPAPLRAVLEKAMVPNAAEAYADLAAMKADLDQLITSGEYSPTTFNIAFLMHTLFRGEDEADAAADQAFLALDRAPFKPAPPPPEPKPVRPAREPEPPPREVASPPAQDVMSFGMEAEKSNKGLLIGVGVAAVVCLIAVLAYFAFFRTKGPSQAETAAQEQLAKMKKEQQEMAAKLKALEDEKSQLTAQVDNAKTADEKAKAQKALDEAQKRLQAQKEEQKKLALATPAAPAPSPKETTPVAPPSAEKASAASTPTAPPAPPPAQTGSATATQPAAAAPEPAPAAPAPEIRVKAGDFVEAWNVDVKPKQLSDIRVDIPSVARQNHVSGTIYLEVDIDEAGKVTAARAVKGLPTDFGMNAACEAAARKLKFSPAIKEGLPVRTKMTFPIRIQAQ